MRHNSVFICIIHNQADNYNQQQSSAQRGANIQKLGANL